MNYNDIESDVVLKDKRKRKPTGKKSMEKFDNLSLKHVEPMTEAQREFFLAFKEGYHVVADGAAGTGKTFISTYLALDKLFKKEVEHIIFVRSAVNIRAQGYLPGTLDEKETVYTVPFKEAVNYLCENGTAWDILQKKSSIKFMTTTYIRGITLDNCVVVVDEFQNMDASEMESILTRIGKNSRIIICGDTRQNDLNRKRETSCHDWLLRLTSKLTEYFDVISFRHEDIVRSAFCKAVIQAIDDL